MKINRQIPNGIDKSELKISIDLIKKSFSNKWLSKKQEHPLRELWKRKDFLATSELYVIGKGIKKLLDNDEIEWLNNFIKEIKKHKDIRQIQAICYELFIYTMIQNKVKLSKPNQQSFDLTILRRFQNVRVSIKRLTTSDIFTELSEQFEECKKNFIENLNKNYKNGYQIILMFNNYEEYSLQKCKHFIEELLFKEYDLIGKNFSCFIKKMKCEQKDWFISNKEKSFLLNLVIKMNEKEQKRFINLFKKAVRNLNQMEPDKNNINMLVIGLPEYVSLDLVESWINKEFNKGNYSRLSAVLLTRYLPVQNIKDNTTHLNLEFRFIYNKKAKFMLNYKDELFKFELPIGTISQEETVKEFVSVNKQVLELKDYYSFQDGCLICEPIIFNKELKYEFNYKQNFIEKIIVNNSVITPIIPIKDKLLCL